MQETKETKEAIKNTEDDRDVCVRSFDPESHRFSDADDACIDGENSDPTYRVSKG